jgi:hypothetical protein
MFINLDGFFDQIFLFLISAMIIFAAGSPRAITAVIPISTRSLQLLFFDLMFDAITFCH